MRRALVLLAALAPLPAMAEEARVEIPSPAGRIVGTMETPDAASDPGLPAVLLLHGFTGSRDELPVAGTDEGVFSRTARLLAEAGHPSLRIDFLGSGKSLDHPWSATTFSGQITDAEAALDHLAAEEPGRPVVLLGWSQGGLVAAHVAAMHPEVAGVILWAPVAQPRSTFGNLLGRDLVESALSAAPGTLIEASLPWGATTSLDAAFFHELVTTDPVAALAAYGGPVLVVVGARDDVVAPQPQSGELFLRYHDGEERLVTLDMGHDLGALAGPEVLDGMVADALAWMGQLR